MTLPKRMIFLLSSAAAMLLFSVTSILMKNQYFSTYGESKKIYETVQTIKHLDSKYRSPQSNKSQFASLLERYNLSQLVTFSKENVSLREIKISKVPYTQLDPFIQELFNANFKINAFEITRQDGQHVNIHLKVEY